MHYRELFKVENDLIRERFDLSMERISGICQDETVNEQYQDYFRSTGLFIKRMEELYYKVERNELDNVSIEELKSLNEKLYSDILGDNYDRSYANPEYAVRMLGDEYGRILSFLYTQIRGMIVYAYESRLFDITIHSELFIEIYNCFEQEEPPTYKELQSIIYWFVSDYSDVTVEYRIREQIDPDLSFAADIIMESDLNDISYLYRFGEYIADSQIRTAKHLNALSQERIDAMARTFTEGYRIGFVNSGKDLSKKSVVNIRYTLGFERMIRAAIKNFEEMGLQPVIYRAAVNAINKNKQQRIGYYGAIPNKQYDYDHRDDEAIYLNRQFTERKLGVVRSVYERYKNMAGKFAGPAVMETFGEEPFTPAVKEAAYRLSDKQQKLSVSYANEASRIINDYIPGTERSFTIIAYPIPEIGPEFSEIFDEVVKINTLDYKLYERIQQTIIDTLDAGTSVHIQGMGDNKTDLIVQLYKLSDPSKQTIFENCVADVNIPVGEVFTSPVLQGTNGVLHVTQVYLHELNYKNLEITFEDGMIKEYSCSNFDSEEENKKYVKENILYHRETLPLGEFAIGTNTTAYVVANKYQIADKMPILIAEKMGPHFAVGDTCYSWAEDTPVFNPNGKEIAARDNELSLLRKVDVSKAYVGCHTDITIPYEELGLIEVIKPDGSKVSIIEKGRFVLPGTQELNKPFEDRVMRKV